MRLNLGRIGCMPKSSQKRRIRRSAPWFYLTTGVLIVIGIVATVAYLRPFPPSVVVMTTGTPGSDYDEYARRYQSILARAGVELRLMPSAGALENLQRLNDPRSGVSVGFVAGGLTTQARSPNVLSLGTLFYEPIWLFYRSSLRLGPHLEGIRGRKASIGPEGSASRALAFEMMGRNGLDPGFAQLLPLTASEAAERLLRGEIDAAFMVAAWDSTAVRRLLAAPQVALTSFGRADAYAALNPFLNKLVLPAGVGNMAEYRPPNDVLLLAPKASLIVRKELHPAVQYLLLDAAVEIHSGPGMFRKSGQFPAPEQVDLPLSTYAQQFYKSGPPFLQRYLPYWLAVLVERLLLILIPVAALAYPVLSVAPQVYDWSIRRRIARVYGELKLIEVELDADTDTSASHLLARLDRLAQDANQLRVPDDFAHLVYTLLDHIDSVRARMQQGSGRSASS
jgi:TRAP-type uncharacterized transport system substrate-binding protein